ncbi:hypothetical protein [Thalassotalea litorea]|uniref:hypothetical protein n=1 Tax=Thalassotalea litorea TaxID=2020715 RepID=UPI003734DF5B
MKYIFLAFLFISTFANARSEVIAYKNGFMFYTDDNSEIKKYPIDKLHKGLLDPDVYFWGDTRDAWHAYYPDFIRNILLRKKQEYIIGIKMLNQQVIESEVTHHTKFEWYEEVLVATILSDTEYVFEILAEFEKCEALDIFTNIKTIPSFSDFAGYPDAVFGFLVKIGHYKVEDQAEYYEHLVENLKKEYICNQS